MNVERYLDANAGIGATVLDTQPFHCGNPSNYLSYDGAHAADAYDTAHTYLRNRLGSMRDTLIITSGATESNANVLYSIQKHYPNGHVVILSTSHSNVRIAADEFGIDYTLADRDNIKSAINHRTVLVTFPHVDPKTGIILGVRSLVRTIRKIDPLILIHCDATQSVGRMRVRRTELRVDLMTFSAHKFGGLKGVGGLLISPTAKYTHYPLIPGSQQGGMRGGTMNVPGVVLSARALRMALGTVDEDRLRVMRLTEELYERLSRLAEVINVGSKDEIRETLGNTLFLRIDNANVIVEELAKAGYSVGVGSACSTSANANTIRISLPYNTELDVDDFLEAFEEAKRISASPAPEVS